jgi:hypothetical protein
MTIPIPRHAVNDSLSIVTPGKQVDEVTTLKQKYFNLAENKPLEPCSEGTNHVWDKFAKGGYVITGFLSCGKQCIGERCGRYVVDCLSRNLFVPRLTRTTQNSTPRANDQPMDVPFASMGCALSVKITMRSMCRIDQRRTDWPRESWIEEGASIE